MVSSAIGAFAPAVPARLIVSPCSSLTSRSRHLVFGARQPWTCVRSITRALASPCPYVKSSRKSVLPRRLCAGRPTSTGRRPSWLGAIASGECFGCSPAGVARFAEPASRRRVARRGFARPHIPGHHRVNSTRPPRNSPRYAVFSAVTKTLTTALRISYSPRIAECTLRKFRTPRCRRSSCTQ